jgi:hypothetical protein
VQQEDVIAAVHAHRRHVPHQPVVRQLRPAGVDFEDRHLASGLRLRAVFESVATAAMTATPAIAIPRFRNENRFIVFS